MKGFFFLFFAIPALCFGQDPVLQELMPASSYQNVTSAEAQIRSLVFTLKEHRPAGELAFLKKVFRYTERKMLRQYEAYSEFNEIFTSGKYDCLTATAFFSIVLDRLEIKYQIIETNYHIFLLVNTRKGDVLLETTDRWNGVVRNSQEIKKRVSIYQEATGCRLTDNANVYRYHFDLLQEVRPAQLPGLLLYNQAVRSFNNGKLEECASFLVKANAFYNTPRIAEFSSVLLKSLPSSHLDNHTKNRLANQLKGLAKAGTKSDLLASR